MQAIDSLRAGFHQQDKKCANSCFYLNRVSHGGRAPVMHRQEELVLESDKKVWKLVKTSKLKVPTSLLGLKALQPGKDFFFFG